MTIATDISTKASALAPAVAVGLLGHQARVADLTLADQDALFWSVRLACGTCIRSIREATALLDEISSAVQDTAPRKPETSVSIGALDTAERHLLVASTETSPASTKRRVDLAANSLVKYADSIGGGVGGTLPLSPDEASALVNDALAQFKPLWTEIDNIQANLDLVVPGLPTYRAPAVNSRASAAMAAVSDLKAGVYVGTRERTLTALAAASSVRKVGASPDVMAAKWEGQITPTGPASRAKVTSTLSAPYDIKAATTLNLVVDGAAVAWALPVGTAASIATGDLAASITFTSGVDDVFSFTVETTTVVTTFGTGLKTRAQILAAIVLAAGASATVTGSFDTIVITSNVTGPSSYLLIYNGSANRKLAVASYRLVRGEGVSVLALQSSAASAGIAVSVLGAYKLRGTASATANGTTTLTFGGSAVPTGTEVGDQLLMTGASTATAGRAWYRVLAVNLSSGVPISLTVDRAIAVGTRSIEVISDKASLSSLSAVAGSEVSVLTAVTSVGLAAQAVRSGTLRCLAAGLPTARPALAGDILRLSSGDVAIRIVGTGELTLASAVSATESASIHAQGAVSLPLLDSGLVTWRADRDARKHNKYSTMGFDKVLASLSGRGGKAAGLAAVSSVRVTLTELEAALQVYAAAPRPLFSAAITAVRADKYDLAADMLMQARLTEFFALPESGATYSGDMANGLVDLASALPVSNVDLSTYAARPDAEPAFVDDDQDEPNDDGLVLQGDDEDEQELVF